jgi:NADH-quinone oxidoreductase subunit C
MTPEEIFSFLQSGLPDVNVELQKGEAGDSWILLQPADVLTVLGHLKSKLGLNYLACLSGVDYESTLGVVYILRSMTQKFEIMVKVLLPKDDPKVTTVSDLFPSAEWFEREAFDLLGIRFQDHPDLRRLMMPEDWKGHPLRKDYQPPAEYHGIPCDRPDAHELLQELYPQKEILEGQPTTIP